MFGGDWHKYIYMCVYIGVSQYVLSCFILNSAITKLWQKVDRIQCTI